MKSLKVIKRDGKKVEFDETKIYNAVIKAFKDVYPEEDKENVCIDVAKDLSVNVKNSIMNECLEKNKKEIDIERIQDLVENLLMNYGYYKVAKAYIKYRYDREKAREKNSNFMKAVSEKLMAKNVQNQNANMDEHSFGGRKGEASNVLMKKYALDYCMSDLSRKNHINNEIYIHDLDSYAIGQHNCLSIPFDDLLRDGFVTRQQDIRPAKSINSAFQLVAVIFQLQSLQQFGGVSSTHLDWTMVPYVRMSFYKHFCEGLKYLYDENEYVLALFDKNLSIDSDDYKYFSKAYKYAKDMTTKELNQAVEGFFHNLNTLQSRSGN